METLVRLLPGPQPAWIRFGITTLLVLAAFGLRVNVIEGAGRYGFIYYVLPVVAASLVFDRASGFYAIALSCVMTAAIVPWDHGIREHVSALAVFAVVGICLVFVAEGLHAALLKAHAAQRASDLLLQEMSHRVKNKFGMISSIIALQARRADATTRRALEDVAARVNVIATVHDYLQLSRHDGLINMQEYLGGLGKALREALCGPRPITIEVSSAPVQLAPERALAVGLIVNELVTNAFKYAFDGDRPGRVQIFLSVDGPRLSLSVADDGKGFDDDRQPGLGTRLVSVFAAQLGGSASWHKGAAGSTVTTVFPA